MHRLVLPLVLLVACVPQADGSCADCRDVCLLETTEGRSSLSCVDVPAACPELVDSCDSEGESIDLSDACELAFEPECGVRTIDQPASCDATCSDEDCAITPTVTCSV